MKTSQFEGVKVAIKQDKTGYILTLSIHPDEVPDEILRDFVGARYQVVMVRLNGVEKPMNREQEQSSDIVRSAALLCRDPNFHKFLADAGQILEATEDEVTEWLRNELEIQSRSELKTNQEAAKKYSFIYQEYQQWKSLTG